MKDIFNKRQRFSIRKFSVGVASVLIGVSLFAPTQGVLASTENNNDNNTGIEVNSETDNSLPTVEIKEEAQSISEHRNNASSEIDAKEISTVATKETVLDTSGGKENINSTATTLVAGEDRSSTPEVRSASNPTEIKKYELTEEDAKKIKAGIIGSEGDKYDSLLLDGPELKPNGYTDNDYLSDKDEIYIYEKNGKKYVGYNSHPLLEDTDGDGIIDSDEKSDEKLKWNVSERDMIMFMELSYRKDDYIDKVLNHKNPIRESELYKKKGETRPRYEYMMMHNELAPYWKRKKSYHTSSGLDAVLFETKSDFPFLPNGTAQVLAFRGTSDGKDIVADGVLGTGSNPQQGIDAENIMRELAKDKSITNLYLTGHSLGGYLVQRAMVEAYQLAYSNNRGISPEEKLGYKNFYENILKKGTTFNAPKVRTGLFSSSAFWQKGLDSKNIAKSGKMTHYIVNNDSTIGKSVSNDSDVVINVGNTKGGHSSRSYFEADMINRRPEFISGKRISLDGIGFQNPKITTAKSLEKVGETVVYSKLGNDIIKSTTVSIKDPDTGNITKNTLDEMFKKDGAKDKVETTAIPSPKKYVKDDTREKGQANVEVPGKTGEQTVTTTYSVNPNTGDLIEHVGQPVVKKPATETVVKVAAKDEVEYIKKGADVVKKTTSYTVNSKTGSLTSTEKEEVVNRGGARDIVEYNSVEPTTVYLKDVNSPKGTNTVQFPGKAGKTKVTTTYSVNPVNGTLTPSKGKPEVATLTIARVVKVGAKDKVVETPIEPEVEYVKDVEKNFGTPSHRTEGKKGKTVTTTTYDVDPKNGHITEHVGTPVVSPAGKTIVKVGAKTKVEQSKDSEGRDVIDTTTYEVDSKTGKVTPTTVRTYGITKEPKVELEQDPKTGDVTVTPKKPDGSTYPPGTKVEIPGKDGNPIIVTIDKEGKVPNSDLPDVETPGTGKITEPGKPTVEVPNVTTPSKVTPTLDVERDPETGDVTVTPKKPDGSTYPPGTTVEIPGKDGKPITVTIGEDGKGKVPNSDLPDVETSGTGKITEPGKSAVEVPNVTTPAKFTPETPVTEKPGKIEITQQPNGNAIVTPKKPDGTTYPSGSKVEIPGENGTTITVTIGDNGSGEVPNDKLPKTNVPGTGTVTEPNKKPSQPVDVTTPARKTPTIELDQDPETGDVTVTPKKPDGSTYPPGTTVEIPGKDGNPIIVTIDKEGKGKVPNSELPDGKVPGTGKITEPGQPTVEVPDVTTPGKVTPSTDTNPVAPVTPDMPVKPDTNGDSGQDKPAPATPTPNADQVDTKTTVDNGAKSNDSQKVLPNTGTESNATLASLGLLGILGGLGLALGKKKED